MIIEHGRGLHTLDEHHSHLLADSFGGSIGGSALSGAGPSSSQFDGGFGLGFDDNVFALPEGAGDADIGDELARELGEGWGGSALQGFVLPRPSLVDHCLTAHSSVHEPNPFDLARDGDAFDLGGNAGEDFRFDAQDAGMHPPDGATSPGFHDRGINSHEEKFEVVLTVDVRSREPSSRGHRDRAPSTLQPPWLRRPCGSCAGRCCRNTGGPQGQAR